MRAKSKNRIKIRLPLPKKPGHPQGTPKGKKGYRRKGRRVRSVDDFDDRGE